MELTTILGFPIAYWIELQRQLVTKVRDGPELITELYTLRGKVMYLEQEIAKLARAAKVDV